MKLSRTVSYAVNATLQLARLGSDHPITCRQLAAAGQMPEKFLLHVLRDLVSHGIMQSTRGVDGGYHMGRSLDQISLLEVIEAIDGPLGTTVGGEPAPGGEDRLRQALEQITATARAQLAAIKLIDLMPPAAESPAG
jgi:Rrf2 family protein